MCQGERGDSNVFKEYFACRKCEGNIGEAVEQEEELCDEGGRLSAGG